MLYGRKEYTKKKKSDVQIIVTRLRNGFLSIRARSLWRADGLTSQLGIPALDPSRHLLKKVSLYHS